MTAFLLIGGVFVAFLAWFLAVGFAIAAFMEAREEASKEQKLRAVFDEEMNLMLLENNRHQL